jgi:hypothetical protein
VKALAAAAAALAAVVAVASLAAGTAIVPRPLLDVEGAPG